MEPRPVAKTVSPCNSSSEAGYSKEKKQPDTLHDATQSPQHVAVRAAGTDLQDVMAREALRLEKGSVTGIAGFWVRWTPSVWRLLYLGSSVQY